MGAGPEAFTEGMKRVCKNITDNYEGVTRIEVMDIDTAFYGKTNAAGVVIFENAPNLGFDVEISRDGSYSSRSHKGRVENTVNLWTQR